MILIVLRSITAIYLSCAFGANPSFAIFLSLALTHLASLSTTTIMSSAASTLAGQTPSVLSDTTAVALDADPVRRDTFNVGGINTHVYSLASLNLFGRPCPEEPIAALFVLHGRQGSMEMESIEKTARDALLWTEDKKQKVKGQGGKQRDFVVVTLVSTLFHQSYV